MFVLFLELGPPVHWSRDELWAGALRSMGDRSGNWEEVKTIHNEKAPTFHETLEAGVKDAGNSGAVTRISGDPSWN